VHVCVCVCLCTRARDSPFTWLRVFRPCLQQPCRIEMLDPQSQALRQYLLGRFFGRLKDKDADYTITPQVQEIKNKL
jgi:hypothetical protein